MALCGCGGETEVKAGCGIHITGSGEADEDPYVVNVDPAGMAGDGLKPAGHDCYLSTNVVPGGGIEYDPNGAMFAADCLPDVDPSKPTVDALLQNRAQSADIVGGMLGGGYLYKPQSTKASVEYARERGLDMAHLPLRMLHDGTPVVTPDPMLGRQNGNVSDFGKPTPVVTQDYARWRRIVNTAGVNNPATGNGQPQPNDPAAGWFGWLESNETGLLTLDDALDTLDNTVVVVLDLQWPGLRDNQGNPEWADGQDPTPQRVTAFLEAIKRAVRRRGAMRHVIAVTQWPYLPPPAQGQPLRNVLDELQLQHTGPALYTPEDADRLAQAPGWQSWTWLAAHRTVPPDKIKPQTDQGKHAILFPITRHSDHERYVPAAGAIAVLSGDPEYTAGHLRTHPAFGQYRYRKNGSTYHFSTIEHGLIAPRDEYDDVHPNRRGLMPRYMADPANPPNPDPAGEYTLGADAAIPDNPAYWVLQGWLSPVEKLRPEDEMGWSFDLSWWVKLGGNAAAEVLFCRASDKPFDGFGKTEDRTGYIASFRGDQLVLVAWDPAANATVDMGALDTSKLAKDWVAVRACVRDDGITLAVLDRDSNEPLQDPAPYSTAQEQDANKKRLGTKDSGNRGGYVFFARTLGQGGGGGDQPPPDNGAPPPPPDGEQPPPPPPPEEPPPPPQQETYVVQQGDTLSRVAQKTGADQKAIQDANHIENPDQIREGDTLKIPR